MKTSGMIAWFARNHVAANILMGVIVVSGLLALGSVKREVFPASDTYQITVSVAYPGAAPEEVEEGICKRIENEIFGLEGTKKITSTATEGAGAVSIEVMREFDVREVLDEVKTRIDSIENFPVEAREPLVREVIMSRQAVSIAVSGDTDEMSLKALGEKIRDDLADLPEITQVVLASARRYEISIEISEASLRRHGLTLGGVARSIRRSSLDLPGGSVKTRGGEIMLRSVGQRYKGDEFADIVLLTRADGTVIRVSDVGRVIDGFADSEESSRFDGKRAVLVQVFRVGDQDVFEVVNAARAYVERMQHQLPKGIHLTTWNDETVLLESRIDLLTRNLLTGLVLVFFVLAVFLRLRLAFWVALGIPISFLGCAAMMPVLDISVNMITLFAFLMVLGIVVDDAIIVGESVHTQRRSGHDGIEASIRGTKLVSLPVTFGVLTTIAAFTPMLNMDDNARKLWQDIGLIVISCLIFSLIESKLILPAHLAASRFDDTLATWFVPRLWGRFRGVFTSALDWFVATAYTPFLAVAIRSRYVTVSAAVTLFALTIGLVFAGFIKTTYFPQMEGDNVVANLVLAQGTPVEETTEKVRIIADAARRLREELARDNNGGRSEIEHILTSIGTQPFSVLKSQHAGKVDDSFDGSHLGEVNIQLAPAEVRTVSAEEVMNRWKRLIGSLPDVEELSFSTDLFGTGKDINIELAGEDIDDLRSATNELKDRLKGPGVSEVADSFRGGKKEIELRIKPAAEMLGLTLHDLASQVRQAFYGEEVQRIQKKGEDVRVMVRYPEVERRSLASLEDMRIRTPSGDEVPFDTVAEVTSGRGFATITRANRARTISVTAKVDSLEKNANEIVARLDEEFLPSLVRKYPGLETYSFEGDNRDQVETQKSLRSGYLVVLFLIYALLAIPFNSFVQPFLVMMAIPFGFIGAILGHWALGLQLSIMSMFGFVALTGVVVNDNLVLIDYINKRRAEGTPLMEAVSKAGVARFRPILLTSLTTCASLTPLLLERSVQAMFLIPMAVSLAFGVLFATVISLILVPSSYLILEDLRLLVRNGVLLRVPDPEPMPASALPSPDPPR